MVCSVSLITSKVAFLFYSSLCLFPHTVIETLYFTAIFLLAASSAAFAYCFVALLLSLVQYANRLRTSSQSRADSFNTATVVVVVAIDTYTDLHATPVSDASGSRLKSFRR